MPTPMTGAKLKSAIESAGVAVYGVKDWLTHNRNHKGAWGPVEGIMIHHTVTKGKQSSIDICYNGHADLPGPLCHGVITKDGEIHLVSAGRSNHAGAGDSAVLAAVKAGEKAPVDRNSTVDGNRYFYGFECENLGNGSDPWPSKQIDAIVNACVAICREHGWNENHVIGHSEWQPGKIDPLGPGFPGMDELRKEIKERLNEEELDMKPEDIFKAVVKADAIPAPPSSTTKKTNPTWKMESYFKEIYEQNVTIIELLKKLAK